MQNEVARHREMRQLIGTFTERNDDADPGRQQEKKEQQMPQAQAAVRLIGERSTRSPRPEYRAYQLRLRQDNCALAASLHNSTTPAQRQVARAKLKGWEEDLRSLAASTASNGNGNGTASR